MAANPTKSNEIQRNPKYSRLEQSRARQTVSPLRHPSSVDFGWTSVEFGGLRLEFGGVRWASLDLGWTSVDFGGVRWSLTPPSVEFNSTEVQPKSTELHRSPTKIHRTPPKSNRSPTKPTELHRTPTEVHRTQPKSNRSPPNSTEVQPKSIELGCRRGDTVWRARDCSRREYFGFRWICRQREVVPESY